MATAATPDNTLVMAWNIDAISTFDPAQIGEVVSNEILMNICSSLVNLDPDNETKVIPALAESWHLSDDGLEIVFNLRKTLKFSDGQPATAYDLAWSLQRVIKLGLGNAATLTEYGFTKETIDTAVTATDPYTLVIKLDKPYPLDLFLTAIGANRVSVLLNKQAILANEVSGDFGNKYLATHMDCVGPYRLIRWNPSEVVQLQANDQYWGEAPKLSNILIRHVTEAGTQRLLLEKGDVDVARDLSPEDMRDLAGQNKINSVRTLRPQLVFLNLNNGHRAFSHPKVRLAMRYLIDYQAIADTVIKDIGIARASFVQLGAFGALDEKQGEPFKLDIEKARSLLLEAGYENGFEVNMLIGSLPYTAPIAQSIQDNASKVGIKINIERMANNQLFSRVRAREFDTSMMAWQATVPDAHGNASRMLYNPDNRPDAKQSMYPSWRVGYYNEDVNKKVMQALFEKDREKRQQLYFELQRDMFENGPIAYIFQSYYVAGLNKKLHNWTWNGFRVYYNLAQK
ncbi:ABC transporter substrate-binding protein (plasmid) [Bartonella sp. HY329]|nr:MULTISPECIES: ABC transporter substrate-binding protein [unclassified Bartonella]UXM96664.1 ABC transporter substrate-binding protein [Bartonella sp. HY329]UXN10987.1 ABC transporter substrate-binding protein [Bartonella sp. HY328]